MVIIGLVILVASAVAGVAGVLSNDGGGHALTHPFAVFGYHAAETVKGGAKGMAGRRRPPGRPGQGRQRAGADEDQGCLGH